MTPEQLKEMFDKLQNSVSNFKQENEKAITNGEQNRAETNTKLDKMAADIAEQAEKYNNAIADQKKRMEELEALVQNGSGANVDEKEKNAAELKEHFNSFVRSGSNLHFGQYLKEQNALSVDSDPDGGYLILPTYAAIRKTREFESTPLRRLANVTTIGTDRMIIPVDYDEMDCGWVSEMGTRSESDTAQIGQIEIPVHELYAWPAITTKMIEDAGFDIEGWVSNKVARKFGRKEATAFVSGNGVDRPYGILSYSNWTTAGTFEHGKIEQIASGSAGAATADGLKNIQNSVIEVYQGNSSWIMNRTTFGAIAKLKDGDGQYLFNRNLDKSVGTPFDLLDRPVYFGTDMPVVAANSLSIAYGDFREAYQIADRVGIFVLRDPYSSSAGKVLYKTHKRVGGAVVNFEAIKIQKMAASV